MIPDWLQYLENRSRAAASTITEHQRKTSLAHSIVENDIPKLLSALKLAIEGLEFYASEECLRDIKDPSFVWSVDYLNQHKAREILEKIKRGEL